MKYKFINKFFALFLSITIFTTLTSCRSSKKVNSDTFTSDYSSTIEPMLNNSIASSESTEPIDNGIRLVIASPTKTNISVTEPEFTFTGTSDPAEPLTVNGKDISRGQNGIFTYTATLSVGKNTFTFKHKNDVKYYTINYRYVIIVDYSPSNTQSYRSGSTIVVNVTARNGSLVTATFNGQTVNLTRENKAEQQGDFSSYNGVFNLPKDNPQDLDLGVIKFTASHNGKSETFSSGKILCKKSDIIIDYDPNATPTGGKYINVGSGYIAEIVEYNAETFDGNVSAASLTDGSVDWSRPTNNYLPKGTIDYCSTSYVNYKESDYVTLRAGYRVYLNRKDKPHKENKAVVRQYLGTLPDHNEISISSLTNNGSHTVITLDSLWKAPFYFDILPQSYTNPARQDYSINSFTCNYIDITFCYATKLEGELLIPEDNPIFSSAKIIENKNSDGTKTRDYTLRLFLKKQGAFYGWDSYYNENNQLCFEFLNPKSATAAQNEYGADLTGIKVLIDVGHGGIDVGAIDNFNNKNPYHEAERNLFLANKLKTELENIGATVYMTRTDNSTSSTDDKIKLLKNIKPDYCIAIHHNSNSSGKPNGFDSYYFNPFSKNAAELVFESTRNTGNSIYKDFGLGWHYYFMARTTNCPVVLTENGFISNSFDYANIVSNEQNIKKAKAITKGIAEYFLSIK